MNVSQDLLNRLDAKTLKLRQVCKLAGGVDPIWVTNWRRQISLRGMPAKAPQGGKLKYSLLNALEVAVIAKLRPWYTLCLCQELSPIVVRHFRDEVAIATDGNASRFRADDILIWAGQYRRPVIFRFGPRGAFLVMVEDIDRQLSERWREQNLSVGVIEVGALLQKFEAAAS